MAQRILRHMEMQDIRRPGTERAVDRVGILLRFCSGYGGKAHPHVLCTLQCHITALSGPVISTGKRTTPSQAAPERRHRAFPPSKTLQTANPRQRCPDPRGNSHTFVSNFFRDTSILGAKLKAADWQPFAIRV